MLRASLLLALWVMAIPLATAQREVDACEMQCLPHDEDVNGPGIVEQGPVSMILYAHPQDIVNRMPMSTQMADPTIDPPIDVGLLAPTIVTETGTDADLRMDASDLEFQVGQGYIGLTDEGARWCMCVPVRSFELAKGPITLYGYLSADVGPTDPADAGVLAPVRVVVAWLRASPEGPIAIAQGVSETFAVSTNPNSQPMVEVRVPLRPIEEGVIGCSTTFRPGDCELRLRIEQVTTPAARATQRDWRFRSAPDHLWHLVVPVLNPLATVSTEATLFDQNLTALWTVETVFGPDDLAPESVRLEIKDGSRLLWAGPPTKTTGGRDHDAYRMPARIQWMVPRAMLASPGPGTVLTFSGVNAQGTYRLTTEIPFPADPAASARNIPAADLFAAMVVVALAAAWVRRPLKPL